MVPQKIEFQATLVPSNGWVCIVLPKDATAKLGSQARVPVVGTINGFPIRTSVFPRGDGSHFMMVNKTMQKGAGVRIGDRVTMILQVDTKLRAIVVPRDLRKALTSSKTARTAFHRLSYTHKKEL